MVIINEGEYTEETHCSAEASSTGNKNPGQGPDLRLFIRFYSCLVTMLIKSADQVLGNHLGGTALNLVSFDKMNQLSVLEKGNGR